MAASLRSSLIAVLAALAAGGTAVHAQDASEMRRLDELDRRCEAARAKVLAPERARLVERCAAEKKRTRPECEAEFAEYGNTQGRMQGGAQAGLHYDLPECKAAFEARQKYRQ
jgi:hypothetical protein